MVGKLAQGTLVLGFLAVLYAGLLGMLLDPDSARLRSVEFREASAIAWPQALGSDSIRQFFASVGKTSDDRLPFRWQMLSAYARMCFSLGITPFPDRVLLGQGKWLFLGNSFENAVDKHRGLRPMTPGELNAAMASLRARRRACAVRGVNFMFVVAPNKHSVYPEFLPAWARATTGKRRVDTLARAARREGLPMLDLTPTLRKAKGLGELLYFRGDSHWNQLGAFLGFQEIARRLHGMRADIPVPGLAEVHRARLPTHIHGDLLRISLLDPRVMPGDDYVACWYKGRRPDAKIRQVRPEARELPLTEPYWNITQKHSASFTNSEARVRAKLLLLRDSFSTGLHSFFCEMFAEVTEVHQQAVNDRTFVRILESERPDIVVWETAERFL